MIEKLYISFNSISEALHNFAFPETDLVIGIARGGIVPASLIAHQLQIKLKIIRISYRDDRNHPMYEIPLLKEDLSIDISPEKKILIVDDVSVTGKTMGLICSKLADFQITTFVLKGKADLVLFPKINMCVNWPWNND